MPKKKAKTTSSSFTPYHKSSASQSEMTLPVHRYSIGTSETPLAITQNVEYYTSATQGAAANAHAMRVVSKPTLSQQSAQYPEGQQTMTISAPSTTKQSKTSTLKNKAAFEKFHPSQQMMPSS